MNIYNLSKEKLRKVCQEIFGLILEKAIAFSRMKTPCSEVEIRSCISKLYAVHGEVLRKAKRTNKTLTEAELPVLWILTPTFSARMIEEVVGIPPSFLPEEGMKEIGRAHV